MCLKHAFVLQVIRGSITTFLDVFVCLFFRTCLHGGGGSQVGEVARLGGVTHLSK